MSMRELRIVDTSARGRTLDTYELLEQILGLLQPWDLRNSRLVSKAWNRLIARSLSLRIQWQKNERQQPRKAHLLLLGDEDSGNKTLAERWIFGVFDDPYFSMMFPHHGSYQRSVKFGRDPWVYNILCWPFGDIRYSTHLRDPVNILVRTYDSYVLVYNTTVRTSFDIIRAWYNHISSISKRKNIYRGAGTQHAAVLIALVATNCDAQDSVKQVSSTEGIKLASELKCSFYETSARTGDGCDRTFKELMSKCRESIDGVLDTALVEKAVPVSEAAAPVMKSTSFVSFSWKHLRLKHRTPCTIN